MMHDKGRDQWTEEYPSLDTIRGDVGSGDAYVLAADGGRVAAYAVITAKPELAYAAIDGMSMPPSVLNISMGQRASRALLMTNEQ